MKKFKGLIIKETLQDIRVLDSVKITKIEKWDVENPGKFLPNKWTACHIQGKESKADKFAEKLSKSLRPKGCYANLSTEKKEYVIFPNKVFKYKKGDKEKIKEAVEFGKSLEIPERQLDWWKGE